jgi:hypothetical protein
MTPTLQHDPKLGVEYVDVSDEPHHIEQLRNPYVRVYLATIEPGTCTLYHRHRVNTLYIVTSEGSSKSEEPGNQKQHTGVGRSVPVATKLTWWAKRKLARTFRLPTGTVLMQYHAEFPLTHRLCAASENDQPIRMLGIELLTDPHPAPGPPPRLAALPVEYHDGQATVYRIELTRGHRTDRLRPRRPGLLVALSGTGQLQLAPATSSQTLSSGAVQWLDGEDDFQLTNPAATSLHALLIALTPPTGTS